MVKDKDLGSDFALVNPNWKSLTKLDAYRKDYRDIGGSQGWKIDVDVIEDVVKAIRVGNDEQNACALAGLPYKIYCKWKNKGEVIAERVFGLSVTNLTDEETGYLWMYRTVVREISLWQAKSAVILNEGVMGNPDVTNTQATLALDVLSRRNPGQWARKRNVSPQDTVTSEERVAKIEAQQEKKEPVKLSVIRSDRNNEIDEIRKKTKPKGNASQSG